MKEIELYENIIVYQDVHDQPQKLYDIIKESVNNNPDRILGEWSDWSSFGKYIKHAFPDLVKLNPKTNKPTKFDIETINDLQTNSKIQEDQKYFLLELAKGFDTVTGAYISKYKEDFNFNKEELIRTHSGEEVPLWGTDGPSICQYRKNVDTVMAMRYHSDYMREPIKSPGYKFGITANYYFNDDYDGGELDFYIDGNLIKYKPVAGDWVVFPSGHPEVLSKNGQPYLHGVCPSLRTEKYLVRTYWTKYEVGDQEWFDKQEEYGADVWAKMHKEMMNEYAPKKDSIPEGNRIR
jgi:2OG-Fe(II) oxygenase superfamily